MVNFFHKLLNPHCPHCEAKENLLLDTLRSLLESEKFEKREMLKYLTAVPEVTEKFPEMIPVSTKPDTKRIPWRVRRQMLEDEDRNKARILKENKLVDPEVEKLEQELGVH